jgi:hypothetical protein
MPYKTTTRPVIPFVNLCDSVAVDWALEKKLCLFHPDIDLLHLWIELLNGLRTVDRIRRVVYALERDAFRYGITFEDIICPVPGHSILNETFVRDPLVFVVMCEKIQRRRHVHLFDVSESAECYYAADANGILLDIFRLPGAHPHVVFINLSSGLLRAYGGIDDWTSR